MGTQVRLLSTYGVTEAAVYQTAGAISGPFAVPEASGNASSGNVVGRPFPGVRLRVEDSTGEIWVGGVQVARGYLNHPELTEQKFVADTDGVRWFLTGKHSNTPVLGP